MGFREDVAKFSARVEATTRDVFINVASHAHESIVNGSSVTGAAGQPVGQYGPGYHQGSVGGTLRNSWHLSFPGHNTAEITGGGPSAPYAQYIEDGVVPVGSRRGNATGHTKQRLTLRSTVGGFHSIALTIAGMSRIVEHEVKKAVGNG